MFSYNGIILREVREADLEAMRQPRNDLSTRIHLADDRIIDPEAQKRWFDSLRKVRADLEQLFQGLINAGGSLGDKRDS